MDTRPDDLRVIAAELQSLIPDDPSPDFVLSAIPPTGWEILQIVCAYYRVDPAAFRASKSRNPKFCLIRHVVCYFIRKLTHLSLSQAAHVIGYRDFSVVKHGEMRITARAWRDEIMRDDLDVMQLRLLQTVLARATWH